MFTDILREKQSVLKHKWASESAGVFVEVSISGSQLQ